MSIKTYKRQHNKIKNRIKNGHGKPGDVDEIKKAIYEPKVNK